MKAGTQRIPQGHHAVLLLKYRQNTELRFKTLLQNVPQSATILENLRLVHLESNYPSSS